MNSRDEPTFGGLYVDQFQLQTPFLWLYVDEFKRPPPSFREGSTSSDNFYGSRGLYSVGCATLFSKSLVMLRMLLVQLNESIEVFFFSCLFLFCDVVVVIQCKQTMIIDHTWLCTLHMN